MRALTIVGLEIRQTVGRSSFFRVSSMFCDVFGSVFEFICLFMVFLKIFGDIAGKELLASADYALTLSSNRKTTRFSSR